MFPFVSQTMEISADGENFFRMQKVIHDEIPKQLREFFIKKWEDKGYGLWEDSLDNGDDISKKISAKARIKGKDMERLINAGNSKEWDTGCLVVAIYNAGLDIATEKPHIEKLRSVRNKISHLPRAELSQTDTNRYCNEVKDVYKKLKWPTKAIEIIEKEMMKTEEMQRLKRKLLAEKKAGE